MSLRPAAVLRTALTPALALLVLLGYTAVAPGARADSAPADPALPATPATVSADGLPTVQINGVVWSQVVVGNTVYAAGSFTKARPAGSPAGTNEVTRNNLLAYDIRTGELVASFVPDLNAQAMVVAASPDGSRIYVGGDFDTANGQPRYGIAAYSTATGQLLDTFKPIVGSQVRAIAATSTTVYIGGYNFGVAGGAARGFLAAFNASDGTVTNWAPVADNTVNALAVVNNGTAVVIGGHMASVNKAAVGGLAEVDATTGTTNLPFAASTVTQNGGNDSAITALSVDNDTIYASGYSYGSGNLEGVLAINPNGGAVKWVDDCHGDNYSVYATGSVEYIAGHPHVCSNIGGFPQVGGADQTLWTHYRSLAFSKAATGTVGSETGNFKGQPAPSLLNWFPSVDEGTYTGQNQGPWSVTGSGQYIVYGGEFPTVNGAMQQGLVRFAVPGIAPNKVGPDGTAGLTPTAVSTSAGTVRVSWPTTSDQDNATLTYDVFRSDKPGTPVYETTASSTFWSTPELSFLDTTAPAGRSVSYTVTARDPFGNTATGRATSVTVATTGSTVTDDYSAAVTADGATDYWRLDQTTGSTARDQIGTFDLTLGSGVTSNRPGALTGRSDTATAFNGTSSGTGSTQTLVSGPNAFSIEAWFSTTSTTGGKLIGFDNTTTGAATIYDRLVSLNGKGQVTFGVYNAQNSTVVSGSGYNDGAWHHVVATLGASGMSLYLDGKLVGTKANTLTAQAMSGYWRVGGGSTWDGSGPYLQATADEVAVYTRSLTAAQVATHYKLGTSVPGTNKAPTAAFTSTAANLAVSVDGSTSADTDGTIASYAWDFGDGSTGTGKTASHTYAAAGTYSVKLTVTDNAGAPGTVTKSVTVTAAPPPAAGSAIAADSFERSVTGGWGSADTGGTWTISGTAANATVTGGSGRLTAAAGASTGAALGFSARDVSVTADLALDKAASGGGTYTSIGARASGSTMYNAQLYFGSDGSASIGLVAMVNGSENYLTFATLPTSYTAGSVLKLRFEAVGTGTTTLRAKLWPSGTTEPTAWTVAATDTTAALQAAGGLYTELYVSGSATAAQTMRLDNVAVSVPGATPANVAPTAAFTSAVSNLALSLDGSSSTDADGTIASYAWDFGDGSTGTGKTASHTYAAAGTYSVKLTVTDNAGAPGTVTRSVTVTAAPAALATDAFGRSVTGGWGSADTGGAWTIAGSAVNATVTSGSGRLTAAAGVTTAASLGISARDVAFQADVTLQKAPAGGASFVSLGTRMVGSSLYETIVYYAPDGTVTLILAAIVNGAETDLAYSTLQGTFAAGTSLTVRMETSGSGTTTLAAKAWKTGTAEPAAWQVTAKDSTASLQTAGGAYVELYNSSKATVAQTLQVDNLWVGVAGTKP